MEKMFQLYNENSLDWTVRKMDKDSEGRKIAEQIAADPSSGIYAAIDAYGGHLSQLSSRISE